ncbi:hypothetical protein ACFQYP_31040 [Nonomuraea antimicrobica]
MAPRQARTRAAWAGIAAMVAITLVVALAPAEEGAEDDYRRAYEAQRKALAAVERTATPSASPAGSVPTPTRIPDPNCSPAPRPVTVRPIDPEVKRAVDRQWRRVERWLKANAPRTYRTLGAPGRAGTIAVAESQMGVDFPDDLRASLLRHNGSRGEGRSASRPVARSTSARVTSGTPGASSAAGTAPTWAPTRRPSIGTGG